MRDSRVSNDQKSTDEREEERKRLFESEDWRPEESKGGENEEHICGFLIHSFTLLFLLRSSILFIGYFAQFISLTGEGGVFSTIFKRNSAKVKTRLKLHWRHKTQEKALTPLSLFEIDPYN